MPNNVCKVIEKNLNRCQETNSEIKNSQILDFPIEAKIPSKNSAKARDSESGINQPSLPLTRSENASTISW